MVTGLLGYEVSGLLDIGVENFFTPDDKTSKPSDLATRYPQGNEQNSKKSKQQFSQNLPTFTGLIKEQNCSKYPQTLPSKLRIPSRNIPASVL